MISLFKSLFHLLSPDPTLFGAVRSSEWPLTRRIHLKVEPYCQVCRSTTSLNVHHIKPFHLFPFLELDPQNLITLCDDKCHILFGHLGSFYSYNPSIKEDALLWRNKITQRP